MENAGAALARAALATGPGPYLVLCGRGNNGGDGRVCARHLRARGAEVRCLDLRSPEALESFVPADAGTIVDCLLGTGFRGPVRAPLAGLIERVNAAGRPVLACDVPSGLDADGGPVAGACVRATRTLCMLAVKRGCVVHPGLPYCGEVEVDPLGVVPGPAEAYLVEAADARRAVPPRDPAGHKGTFGRVAVLAGSAEYTGAAALASRAALAAGAGLVTLGVPEEIRPILQAKLDEVVVRPRSPELLPGAAAVVAGPGLGRDPATARLALSAGAPLVLDADGLNGTTLEEVAAARCPVVITPHPGEMARLLGCTAAEVQADRFAAVRRAADRGRCVAVLKGARTLIATPGGPTWVNPTGNDGLASGGTGDVLAGLIGGLLAQGARPEAAALAGVYLHGRAADLAAAERGRRGLVAGDLLAYLPAAFRSIGID
jgi:hydroxyethylthiazole kinase-like uncharacterized protein yjeF